MTAALLVSDTAVPRTMVAPTINLAPASRFVVAATKSTTVQVGTMDSTPTESEVLALMQSVEFAAGQDVRELRAQFVAGKPASCAALALLVRINGNDLPEDADAFASGGPDVLYVAANETLVVRSSVPITRASIVAMSSGITSANYEGAIAVLQGVSHA